MSIEIRNMSITSRVLQRVDAGEPAEGEVRPAEHEQWGQSGQDWRAECRRMIVELLDERKER